MPVDAQITDQGPPSFTYPVLRSANVEDWRGKFGDDADTDPESTDGQIIDLLTLPQLITLSNQFRLWADSFVRTARGAALDGLLDMFGLTRIPAKASVGTTVFYGSENTAVALGTQVQTAGSAALFATTAAGTTGLLLGSDTWVLRVPASINVGQSYTADIDGTPYTHMALGGEGSLDVARQIRDLINVGPDATSGLAGTDASGRGLLVIDVTGGPGIVTNGGTDTDAQTAVRIAVEAVDTGATSAPAGTLQVLPTPVAGIIAASNDADVALGRDVESDDEFRSRHLGSLYGSGCGTDQAIRARVLEAMDAQGIDFVASCNVTSNRTDSPTDADGRPIHSFETVVRYTEGFPSDANTLVAEAIASCMPAGILPYGLTFTESVEIYPGNFVDVSATIVAVLYLHLDITVTAGENFPTEGDQEQAIASGVATAWDQIAVEGQDWYETQSAGAVSIVVGGTALSIVILSDLTPLPGDVPVFAAVPSQPAITREIIDLDASRVKVTIV